MAIPNIVAFVYTNRNILVTGSRYGATLTDYMAGYQHTAARGWVLTLPSERQFHDTTITDAGFFSIHHQIPEVRFPEQPTITCSVLAFPQENSVYNATYNVTSKWQRLPHHCTK
jgi:hypothetical protein